MGEDKSVEAYLVTAELCVVQLLQRIFHILMTEILNCPRPVLEHVGETDVPGLPHVVLQCQQLSSSLDVYNL